MCQLAQANKCLEALQPMLTQLEKDYPGTYVVAYPCEEKIKVRIAKSLHAVEKLFARLSKDEVEGAITLELSSKDRVYML